jgi:N6-L-threonylcarbamoyladenine synthase
MIIRNQKQTSILNVLVVFFMMISRSSITRTTALRASFIGSCKHNLLKTNGNIIGSPSFRVRKPYQFTRCISSSMVANSANVGAKSVKANTNATATTTTTTLDTDGGQKIKKKKKDKKASRDKRREFIGKAKAVDNGRWSTIYSPGGKDGFSFVAKSGLPDRSKPFTVLGIESSCDDTGAAVVRSDGVILGESLASQSEIHEEFGGIVPGLAKNAHEEKIDSVVSEAIANAGLSSVEDVDAIGVTIGPGLEICLRVGCNKARELAMEFQKPFVGINHLEAHILMARLPFDGIAEYTVGGNDNIHESKRAIEFPFLALLVSGGHCQLMKCLGIGRYEIIGGTIDDSLGEAFDKTARLLGLPVGGGGGPAVEKLAKEGDPKAVQLPIPLQKRKDFDFSYAGLKTAVRMKTEKLAAERELESVDDLSREDKANVAASFQNVAIKHIEQRLKRTMDMLENEDGGIRSLAVVGGVAANQELRKRLEAICEERQESWKMFVPPPRLCTDQGAMAAWAAVERIMVGSSDIPDDQEVFARFPFQS